MADKKAQYERTAFLALGNISGLGFHSLKKIAEAGIKFFDLLEEGCIKSFLTKLNTIGIKKIKIAPGEDWQDFRRKIWRKGQEDLKLLIDNNVKIIFSDDDYFPRKLKIIDDPPYWLFVKGDLSLLHKFSIAIVGTREPSEDGKFLARYIGLSLPYFKAIIVSGLARGIDQTIHECCIERKVHTVAFLGTGILSDYPAGSEKLKKAIVDHGGALVTEYLLKDNYSKQNFIKRNRLQAGLSEIIIPIEWRRKSGTEHTVNFAYKFNKKLIALKVPVWNGNREEFNYAKDLGADIISIPGEEKKLYDKIAKIKINTELESNDEEA